MTGPRDAVAEPHTFDIAVVGAGPAGLAAAVTAAEAGRRTVVIDLALQLGGQYWRHPDERFPRGDESHGHHDWQVFTDLRARFHEQRDAGRITFYGSTQVWLVETAPPDATRRSLHLTPASAAGGEHPPASVTAATLILCPGGYDRQLPIPGWDLPGVTAAGGVQALLKAHRTLAGRRALVAGTGPFLLPVATQLARAGAEVVAVCEANRLTGWARHLRAVAGTPSKIVEGVAYGATLARYRIPVRTRTAVTTIRPDAGGTQVGSVELSRLGRDGAPVGRTSGVDVDLVALGWGFTPSLELFSAVGADTRMDVDDSLVVAVDDQQRTSVPGVYAAGEATGVGGALLALAEGELAALAATGRGDLPSAAPLRRRIRRFRAFAVAMHTTHRVPRRWSSWLTDDTTICRCEEVDLGAIRYARDELGATDLRTVKLMSRTGMGWCQGRVCGFAVASLAAGERTVCPDDLQSVARQPICAPVSLARLAGRESRGTAEGAP